MSKRTKKREQPKPAGQNRGLIIALVLALAVGVYGLVTLKDSEPAPAASSAKPPSALASTGKTSN